MSRLSELPEDIAILIWKNVFQQSLNKLMSLSMEHLKRCGICKKHLLNYEEFIPITLEYDILRESYYNGIYNMNERSYHCKCQFHAICLKEYFYEDSNLENIVHHRYGCNVCSKMIQDYRFYFGDSDSDEDTDEDSDEDGEA